MASSSSSSSSLPPGNSSREPLMRMAYSIWRSTSTHLRGGNGKKTLHFDYGGGLCYAEIVKVC